MMSAVVDHMKAKGVKTVGYIGFSDSWGDIVLKSLEQVAAPAGIKIVSNERYARADTSVTGQVLKVMAANPDAVVVGGSGTGGALPQIGLVERGYQKQIYHNHGTVNREFIKVGGKAVEGAIAPTGPLIVAEDLPADNPVKKVALDFVTRYEQTFGARHPQRICRLQLRRLPAAGRRRSHRREEGEAGHAGIPPGAARCAGEREERRRYARRL